MRSLIAGIVCVLGACSEAPQATTTLPDVAPQTIEIVGADGASVGEATFTEAPTGILIRLNFAEGRLPPGWHGLHLHERGDCGDAAQGFQASGNHVTRAHGVQHGLLNANGPEAGDLPNVFIGASGASGAEVFSPFVTLRGEAAGDRLSLLDADGAALLIHASADDHRAQPIGNAGARVACAALTPPP
jgi:superoxide dismutase, Cu-Zn family